MKSYKESDIKKNRLGKDGKMFMVVYASKELPTRKDVYSVVLKIEYGGGKGFKHFNPTDQKSKYEFEEQVLTWNKRIK